MKCLECLKVSQSLKYKKGSPTWQPTVTAISESKDLTSLTTTSLFGKLREHELEMNRLNVQESEEKHVRSITLKASKHKSKQESSDESEEENLSLLSKKFSRFLNRNHNTKANKEKYGNKKTSDFNSNNYTCFGCGEQGHIKQIAQTKKAMKRNQATRRKRESQEEHT